MLIGAPILTVQTVTDKLHFVYGAVSSLTHAVQRT